MVLKNSSARLGFAIDPSGICKIRSEGLVAKSIVKAAVASCMLAAAALPFQANAYDCFDHAAAYQQVNANILRAIAIKETSNCRSIVTRNTNGSVDVGCMGINSIHFGELAKHGVQPNDLMDQCKNIFVAAWHYRKKLNRHGNSWKAVGAYHSETPSLRDKYASEVYRIWIRYGLHKQ